MGNRNIILLLCVFLILSIIPACAINIAATNYEDDNYNNRTKNKIQEQLDLLKPQIDTINNDTNSLKDKSNRFKSIWYKPWYWGEAATLVKDMVILIYELQKTSGKVQETSDNICLEAKKLKTGDLNETNTTNVTKYYDKNAEFISKKLEERLNITFTPTQSNGLAVGDVIQYKSQNKYYRYLTVVRMVKNESSVVLEGSPGKNITINKAQLSKTLKLVPSISINGTLVVLAANNIQLDIVNDKTNTALDNEKTAKTFFVIAKIVDGAAASLLIGAAVAGITSFVLAASLNPIAFFVAMGAAALGFAGAAVTLSGIALNTIAESYYQDAKEIRKEATDDLADLNLYMANTNHIPVAQDMQLNTTIDLPINNTFNAEPDINKLNGYIVSQPSHGTVNVTEGDKFNINNTFIYTPNEDYYGNDSFTYKLRTQMV